MTFIIVLFILLIKRWLRVTAQRDPGCGALSSEVPPAPEAGPCSCAAGLGQAVPVSTGRWQEWFAHRKHPVLFVSWCSACLPQKGRLSGAQSFAQPVAGTQASSVEKKCVCLCLRSWWKTLT